VIDAFFSDPVNLAVSIVFAVGMTVCAVLIPMTIRRTQELKEQNDRKQALEMQKRWRHASRKKGIGHKSSKTSTRIS
jgi:hypothetical protein